MPGDLFGVHVRMDEAQAFAFAIGQAVSTVRHAMAPGSQHTITLQGVFPIRDLRGGAVIRGCAPGSGADGILFAMEA